MDWSPDNEHRCDSKLCKYATACNLITLLLILVFITGLAQANIGPNKMVVDFRTDNAHHNDVKRIAPVSLPQKLIAKER